MSAIVLQQDFTVPPTRVFDALADQDTMGNWMGGKISVPVRSDTGLVGTVRRIHVGPFSFDERILEAERPSHIAYRIIGTAPWVAHHHGELNVEPLPSERTRVTWRVELELKPALLGMIARRVLSLVLRSGLRRLATQLS
jgi:uncharacterized protein YndB with AHSA1/START domain